jgi:hypothetical protein
VTRGSLLSAILARKLKRNFSNSAMAAAPRALMGKGICWPQHNSACAI